jgi:HK97 family phage prohead protease
MLKIVTPFTVKADEANDSLNIEGYASTKDLDRDGDVILPEAWKDGLDGYKNNPIILAYHRHDKPIGKATKVAVDDDGLKITAKITKAAGDVHSLIKEGILQTFSVGFRPKAADYDTDTGIFVIKEAELYEISVVSVPANAAAGFNVAKQFKDNKQEFELFRKEFEHEEIINEEKLMPKEEKDEGTQPVDLKALADQIKAELKADLNKEEADRVAAEKAKKEEEDRIAATATTAAERLIKEVEERMSEKEQTVAETLKDLASVLKEKKEEIEELRNAKSNKMHFADANGKTKLTDEETNTAVLLAKCTRKGLTETKYFKELMQKSGQEHFDTDAQGGEWEDTWSTTVENEMRQSLVVEPLFRTFNMPTPTYNFPTNPEAGQAYWIPTTDFRSTGGESTGTEEEHLLSDRLITAEKLAAKEYIGYEEEEDTILPIVPLIRESISRRMALESDRAVLWGEGAANTAQTSSPITGLTGRGIATDVDLAGGAANLSVDNTEDLIVDMRENLGLYGDDASQLVLLVCPQLYYSLLKNDNLKTVDVAGTDRATLLKGEVGSIYGLRVVVSRNFDNTAIDAGTLTTPVAVLVRPSNFIIGNLRGIMTETDRDIENQKNIIVSTRRFAFDEIIPAQGAINLAIAT